jgi:hypothetical protein
LDDVTHCSADSVLANLAAILPHNWQKVLETQKSHLMLGVMLQSENVFELHK